jgi:glycosyltransferase involved in cell wall biosynthesis
MGVSIQEMMQEHFFRDAWLDSDLHLGANSANSDGGLSRSRIPARNAFAPCNPLKVSPNTRLVERTDTHQSDAIIPSSEIEITDNPIVKAAQSAFTVRYFRSSIPLEEDQVTIPEECSTTSFADGEVKPALPKPLIVNCGFLAQKGSFFEAQTKDTLRWRHFSPEYTASNPIFFNERLRRLAVWRTASHLARAQQADIVITHGPEIASEVRHFLKLCGYRGPHLAFTFNYPWLPTGIKRAVHSWGFGGIDRFIVFSTMERRLYHEQFNIPMERIEFMHWGVAPPEVDSPNKPLIDGDYVCAIGGNSRDYITFIESVKRLPDINVVMVVRSTSLAGINVPPNVRVMTDIPWGHAMNVLAFSRFMALPLDSAEVPCGHMTIVSAMHLGKAMVITRSTGIDDYVREGYNGLMVSPKSVDELTDVLRRMWDGPDLCTRLGEAGRAFAAEHCSEQSTFRGFKRVIRQLGVRLADEAVESA